MSELASLESVSWALGAYALIGVLFTIVFVTVGVQRMDAAARGAGVWFRILIVPGVCLLWPVLAVRWAMAGGSRRRVSASESAGDRG